MPQTPAFDPARLRHYPLQEVTADFALRFSVQLTVGGRTRYFQELAAADPRLHTLILLETLRDGLGRDGLHTFLFLNGGDAAPEIFTALRDAGLDREAGLMAEALATFGPAYPVDYHARKIRFGYNLSPDLNAFDLVLMPIAQRFGDKRAFANRIEGYVRRTPFVLERMQQHRAAVSEDTRLRWLQLQLVRQADIYGSVPVLQAGLSALPADYRLLLVLAYFQWEFSNGGVHQFFLNSAGNLAPDVLAAFETLKLPQHAAAMRKALAMFAQPYERDLTLRRARYFSLPGTSAWDKALQDVTGEIEAIEGEPFFAQAVLDFARSRDLIPR